MQSAAKSSRRYFLGALTAASATRVLGANDRVHLGFIGCGLIGLRHIADFKKLPDADLAAVCDAYDARRHYAVEACGSVFFPSVVFVGSLSRGLSKRRRDGTRLRWAV